MKVLKVKQDVCLIEHEKIGTDVIHDYYLVDDGYTIPKKSVAGRYEIIFSGERQDCLDFTKTLKIL